MIGVNEYLNRVEFFEAGRNAQGGYVCELLGHFLTGGDSFVVQESSPTQAEELLNEAANSVRVENLQLQEPRLDVL